MDPLLTPLIGDMLSLTFVRLLKNTRGHYDLDLDDGLMRENLDAAQYGLIDCEQTFENMLSGCPPICSENISEQKLTRARWNSLLAYESLFVPNSAAARILSRP